MGINLTTRAKVKAFLGLANTSTDQDQFLDLLISGVSSQVAQVTDRVFEKRKYKMWLDGPGGPRMRLPFYPIRRLYTVALNTRNAGRIQYTGTGKHATVTLRQAEQRFNTTSGYNQLQDPVLDLTHITTSGTESFTSISTCGKSVTELSTCVNAQSGWSFTVESGFASYPATFGRPRMEWAQSTDDMDFDIADESNAARIVPEAEDLIELLWSGFPCGRSNVFVWWQAGYELPSESGNVNKNGEVPGALELIVNSAIRDLYKVRKKDTSIKEFKLADYSEKYDTSTIREAVLAYDAQLDPWKRLAI